MIMPDDHDILTARAKRAYFRRFGETAPIPASSNSGIEKVGGYDCVVLRNCNGLLAKYRITNGRLRFLE